MAETLQSMFSNLYDTETIQNQNADTSAMNVAKLPAGRATVYGAGVAGNMLSGGLNKMLGRETAQEQKNAIVNDIMTRHANLDPADPKSQLTIKNEFLKFDMPDIAMAFDKQYRDMMANVKTTEYTTIKVGEVDKEGKRITSTYQYPKGIQIKDIKKQGTLLASQPTDSATAAGKTSYQDITTNDDLGNKVTNTYKVLPGEAIKTNEKGDIIQKPFSTYKAPRDMKKVGIGINAAWKYTDNGDNVFGNEGENIVDVNQKADDLYAEMLGADPTLVNTPEGNAQIIQALIENKLTGSNKFATLLEASSQDTVNAAAFESNLNRSVERLSVVYDKSNVAQMDLILDPIERQLNEYVPFLIDGDGELNYDISGRAKRKTGKIPGWDAFSASEKYVGTDETVKAAQEFAQNAATLINTVIKQRSGAAVSVSEEQRLKDEYIVGFKNSNQFARWVDDIRKLNESTRKSVVGGFAPEAQFRYFKNMGIIPTLYNPEEQHKLLPIGAEWKDESGQTYTKSK